MKLPDFDIYIEILVAMRGDFHRKGIVKRIDSLLMKNDPGALLVQAYTKNAPRRFVLDSRLLEVLLQVDVLQPGGTHGYHTGAMRIDQLPSGDGFGPPSIDDRKALRANEQSLTMVVLGITNVIEY